MESNNESRGGRQALIDARLRAEEAAKNEEYVENDTQEAKAGLVSYYILREVNGFDQMHHVLASVSLAPGAVAHRIVLHYWAAHRAPVVIPTALALNHLELLHGRQALGSVWVPPAAAASPDALNTHLYGLASAVSSNNEAADKSAADYEAAVMERVGKAVQAATATTAGDDMVPFALYRFPVWGRSEEYLLLSESKLQLWNWKKPESPYRREGTWTKDLHDMLSSLEMTVGGNLRLILRGANLPADVAAETTQ